jgi:hypothetical protein
VRSRRPADARGRDRIDRLPSKCARCACATDRCDGCDGRLVGRRTRGSGSSLGPLRRATALCTRGNP